MKLINVLVVLAATIAQVSAKHDFELNMKWKTMEPLPFARSDMTATVSKATGDDQIYLVGGCSKDQGFNTDANMYMCPELTNKCTIFIPADNKHVDCAPAPRERYRHAAANIEGKIWVVGGRTLADDLIPEIDVYDPVTDTWTTPYVWPNATSDLAAFAQDASLFLVGGYTASYDAVPLMWEIDTSAVILTAVPATPLLQGRGDIAAAHSGRNTVYLTGGFHHDDWCSPLDSAERYNTTSKTWEAIASLSLGRGDKSLVGLDENLFAIGGEHMNGDCTKNVPVDYVEVYDVEHNTWKVETQLSEKRFRFVAAADEKAQSIYVFGGQKYLDADCNCYRVADDVYSYFNDAIYAVDYSSAPVTATTGVVTVLLSTVALVCAQLY